MARGAPSREDNGLAQVGGASSRARENAPEGAQGQETLHGKQQPPPRPGEAAQETGMDAFEIKYNIADVIGPEEKRSRLMRKTERGIRGGPQRRRGVTSTAASAPTSIQTRGPLLAFPLPSSLSSSSQPSSAPDTSPSLRGSANPPRCFPCLLYTSDAADE